MAKASAKGPGPSGGAKRPSRARPKGPTKAEREKAAAKARRRSRVSEPSSEERVERRREDQQRQRDAIIYAPNWRTPVLIDITGGIVVFLAGGVFAALWDPFVAGGIGALGGLYALLAVRRWRIWAARRREAGLPT